LDVDQQRIADDLAGVFTGDLRFDSLSIALYSSDASLYQIRPMGVAAPRSTEDVVTLTRYAAEQHIPLVARGSGSGLTGGCLGQGLIVDFSRYMTAIEKVGDDTVVVQPGVVLNDLNDRLMQVGRYFAPDPSNPAVTTLGGMLATDAAGSHAIRVGSVRDHVDQIEIVLADGTAFHAGMEHIPREDRTAGSPLKLESESAIRRNDVRRNLIGRLGELLRENTTLIEKYQPAIPRNCAGYYLRRVLREDQLLLPRLLVGSEGTLALFTQATLHTLRLPRHRGVLLCLFDRLDSAVKGAMAATGMQPSACDLLDRRLLSLAREDDPKFEEWITPDAEAALIIEQFGLSDAEVEDRLRGTAALIREAVPSALISRQTSHPDEVNLLWSLPRRVVPRLARLKGSTRPLPIIEGIALAPEKLQEFLVHARRILQHHEITSTIYAHAASGQVHLRPMLAPPRAEDGQRIADLVQELYQAVFALGGTISGEHGDGLSRTSFLPAQYGPLYQVFRQIKQVFDPYNLLNPGKIIGDDPHQFIRNFRPVDHLPEETIVPLQLTWTHEEMSAAASRCNGCGECRTHAPGLRMCPFFRTDVIEHATPRSKANLMRMVSQGMAGGKQLATQEIRELSQYCFNCKQCRLECPSNVDVPRLVLEAKAQFVASEGLNRSDWILSRAHSFGKLGCSLTPLSNRALKSRWWRWLIERILGIDRRRKLPPFAKRPFLRSIRGKYSASPRDIRHDRKPVVFFVDHFANFHDTQIAECLLKILEHNGIDVVIPEEQTGSGMAMASAGDLDAARAVAERNIRALGPFAREGCTILCTEPAAVLCFKDEYPAFITHPDLPAISEHAVESGAYLRGLHAEQKLRTNFKPLPMKVAYHTPCHVRALTGVSPYLELLALIPELQVERVEEGCSGMAGAFGLSRDNFETSVQIGKPLIDRMRSIDAYCGLAECSSCKLQMEQESEIATLHPLKLLAWSYGLIAPVSGRRA
jgi:FAD/FMN-containing dehydrogenase/Fe-S oxidoreductase